MKRVLLAALAALLTAGSIGCGAAPDSGEPAKPESPSADATPSTDGVAPKGSGAVSPIPTPTGPGKTSDGGTSGGLSYTPVKEIAAAYVPPTLPPVPSTITDPPIVDLDWTETTYEGEEDEASSQDLLCPEGQVVTGYEMGFGEYGGGCKKAKVWEKEFWTFDSSGCGGIPVVGGLKLVCSPLNIDGVRTEGKTFAKYGESEQLGAAPATSLSDSCAPGDGAASGVFLRSGDRLDSFGLLCGSYYRDDKIVTVLRNSKTKPTTYQSSETLYGGAPGVGGGEHEHICPHGQAVIGLRFRADGEIHHAKGVFCAGIEPVFMKPIFPLMDP